MGYLSFLPPDTKAGEVSLVEEQLKNIFKQFDTDHNGRLSKDELREAFRYLGAFLPGYRANRGLSYADANGDGEVDLKLELDDLVSYAFKLGYKVN
ncbi:hypothetical protein Tsubulata_045052 [Turnera subulata]|uniref:EF-hand domain-containing protein n=1 Tax=Turnera subulata TaxID=218843 RepID=A0A9Q0G3R1_9ROSI|nr:hypothetical protein Tsubulata_045052 [Turnera subulata]